MADQIKKTSNPIFTEGKDLNGQMPTRPRTEGMFDTKEKMGEAKKPENNLAHGQKSGHDKQGKKNITPPGTQVHDSIPNMTIYFDQPGDYQTS